jgi:hypothetical protein
MEFDISFFHSVVDRHSDSHIATGLLTTTTRVTTPHLICPYGCALRSTCTRFCRDRLSFSSSCTLKAAPQTRELSADGEMVFPWGPCLCNSSRNSAMRRFSICVRPGSSYLVTFRPVTSSWAVGRPVSPSSFPSVIVLHIMVRKGQVGGCVSWISQVTQYSLSIAIYFWLPSSPVLRSWTCSHGVSVHQFVGERADLIGSGLLRVQRCGVFSVCLYGQGRMEFVSGVANNGSSYTWPWLLSRFKKSRVKGVYAGGAYGVRFGCTHKSVFPMRFSSDCVYCLSLIHIWMCVDMWCMVLYFSHIDIDMQCEEVLSMVHSAMYFWCILCFEVYVFLFGVVL